MTISVCMIVKNEEESLKTCLDSLKGIWDELIIVDTGSTDNTKSVASGYTDKLYDFKWTGSFADARNYAFSKAKCDYIYSADADEELDETNRRAFKALKENLDPQIDIVQMYYCNQMENNTIYNFDRELRPKLYKRLRTFTWVEDIHEEVRSLPLVYDSDIEIIHRPKGNHAERDLAAFERVIEANEGRPMSERLTDIYAKELLINGDKENFARALGYFEMLCDLEGQSPENLKRNFALAAMCAYRTGDDLALYKYGLRGVAEDPSSELCCCLGMFFRDKGDLNEARIWAYNAAYETEPVLCVSYKEELAVKLLEDL